MCGDGKESFRNVDNIKTIRSTSKEDETTKPLTADQLLELRKKKFGDENYMGFMRDYMR
jgi:hypothetical protein